MDNYKVQVSLAAAVKTDAAPINPDWILKGKPRARAATLSRSPDGTAVTVAWECTAGVFRWHFADDETVHVVEGGVTVFWNGESHTLGPGDVAFFPAGTVATWSVDQYIRKIAFIRVPPPAAVSFGLKAWRRLTALASGRKADAPAETLATRTN